MNVLDIYPTFSWWICGADLNEIAAIREVLIDNAAAAENARKAFCLVGDAAAFDLIPNTFDAVCVQYSPTPLKRMVLERHAQPWLRPGACITYAAETPEEQIPAENVVRMGIDDFRAA
jgi:hypothetical protein